jgi:hypothetical protein
MKIALVFMRLPRFARNDIKINLTKRQLSFILITTDVVIKQEDEQ